MYSDKVLEHFMTPRNAWYMPNPDGVGSIGDEGCGDKFMMFIRVRNGLIRDISFLVFGCCAAIASGSMTTVLARGKSLEEAFKLTDQDVLKALDGLPEEKQHCSNLGVNALRAAIQDYQMKQQLQR